MSFSETEFDFENKCLGGVHSGRIAHNLTKDILAHYSKIINTNASHFFYTNTSLFLSVGLEVEDLKSICMCYLSSFLSNQSVMVEGEKRNRFIEEYGQARNYEIDPDEKDFLDKDKAVFTIFVRQRLISLIKVVSKKRRELNGFHIKTCIYEARGDITKLKPRALDWLTKTEKELAGFQKIGFQKIKDMEKTLKSVEVNTFFSFEGKNYFKHRLVKKEDLGYFYEKDDELSFEDLKSRFENLPEVKRLSLIEKFIKKNKNVESKSEELEVALEIQSQLKGA